MVIQEEWDIVEACQQHAQEMQKARLEYLKRVHATCAPEPPAVVDASDNGSSGPATGEAKQT